MLGPGEGRRAQLEWKSQTLCIFTDGRVECASLGSSISSPPSPCSARVEKAVKGVYSKESVEQLPKQYVLRFFKETSDGQYRVTDELKEQVIFRQFNLMNVLPFKKPLHVVFLRNVMIYFEEETKAKLLDQIYDAMVPGGYLFIGSTESIGQGKSRFRYIQPSIYRK